MSRIKPAAECVEKYHSISKGKKDYFALVCSFYTLYMVYMVSHTFNFDFSRAYNSEMMYFAKVILFYTYFTL